MCGVAVFVCVCVFESGYGLSTELYLFTTTDVKLVFVLVVLEN